MTRQEAVYAGQDILARMEAAAAALADILAQFNDPFGDPVCDAAYARIKRRWTRLQKDITDWHEEATACIKAGDVSIQFGGGK